MAKFLSNLQWQCEHCGKVHLMERDADKCCVLPYIDWRPPEED